MSLKTLLINGPCGGGKSTVARLIVREVLHRPAHLVRLHCAHDGHTNSVEALPADANGADWASRHCVTYTPDRVFETLPDGLRAVYRLEADGFAILEGDGDPSIRHAYPYDYRIFVMPPPRDIHEVFREARDAAVALQQVMEDTAAFASEIFGLFDAKDLDDSEGVHHTRISVPAGSAHGFERLEVAEAHVRRFVTSPIGAEIASRIQLQPAYHALVEADVALVNLPPGGSSESLRECVGRLEKLLSRIRHDARRHSVLYWGNVACERDPARGQLIGRLKELLST